MREKKLKICRKNLQLAVFNDHRTYYNSPTEANSDRQLGRVWTSKDWSTAGHRYMLGWSDRRQWCSFTWWELSCIMMEMKSGSSVMGCSSSALFHERNEIQCWRCWIEITVSPLNSVLERNSGQQHHGCQGTWLAGFGSAVLLGTPPGPEAMLIGTLTWDLL